MSLGKRIIFLLIALIILIVYTVFTFDYKQTTEAEYTTESKAFDMSSIVKLVDEIKTKAYKIKEELLESMNEDVSLKEEELTENTLIEQPAINEDNVITQLTQEKPKDVDSYEDNEKVTDEIKDTSNSNNNEVQDPKSDKLEIENNEEKIVEEVVVPAPTNEEIQSLINDILEKNKIIFKRKSVKITKKSYSSLKEIANILTENETFKIEVAGHTDSRGKASYNKKISQDRANSVRAVLISLGIEKTRMKAVGYGEKFPIAEDDKNGLSIMNRRVEINILGDKK